MAIRWDKFTVKAQEAVQRANELASEHGNPEMMPLHLLAALVEDKEGIVAPVLEKIGIGPQAVLSELYKEIEKLPKVSGSGGAQQPAMSSQIALAEPTALVAFQTQKLLVSAKADELTPLAAGQWADSVPNLVQAKMVESFENAGFAHVSKATDGFTPDRQLLLEIRSFEVTTAAPATARIEIAARWLGADGKIAAERDFHGAAPASAADSPAVAAALNQAFQPVARDIVDWAKATM